jgi:glycosyltransferase involved in cell wall biosynthesis
MKHCIRLGFIARLLQSRYADRIVGIIKHWPEVVLSFASFVRFQFLRVNRKTILLVEPNTFHGEVLPGFCKYFEDLGYDVVVICRYANYHEDVFCRYVHKPRMFVFDPLPMRWILQTRKISAFDFVLFTSNQIFAQDIRVFGEYIGLLKSVPKPRYGCFYVEHSFHPDEKSYATDIKEMFLLSADVYKGQVVPMLNPQYFGEVRHTPLNRGKRVFVFIGGVAFYKNSIQMLLDAVRKLEKKFEFEVWMIGSGTDSSLSDSLPASIKTFGRLPFEEMFQCIEKADFMLPLLDPENQDHQHYLQGVTSGSRQLILGFNKLAVIHAEFAKRYDFSDKDSILHEDGSLARAMERALTMTETEYTELQQGLRKLAEAVYSESLENLRKRINERRLVECKQ